jgi:catechol 2,3-dioxygenase-like lactoylglutathione lyase family enzyme
MCTVTVRYIVHDVQAAVDFYVGQLGFRVEMQPGPALAMLVRGNLRLLLNAPGAGGAARAGGDPEPGGWNRFQLVEEDLGATVSRLGGAGAQFRSDVIQGRGGRQALVVDPSGNVVELFEPVDR